MSIDKVKIVVYILSLLAIPTNSRSCDCIPQSSNFIDNLQKRQLVIHAKILDHIENNSKSHYFTNLTGITKLEVIHSFKGNIWSDTLIHINGDPNFCGTTIQNLAIGQEVFLKVNLSDEVLFFASTFDDTSNLKYLGSSERLILKTCKQYPNISMLLCDYGEIPIIQGEAQGNITRRYSKYYKRYFRRRKISKSWANKYYRKYIIPNIHYQRIKISKLYSIIEQKIRTYR